MPINITSASFTFHDERRGAAEFHPPMKKAEAHLVAEVAPGEDGTVVLDMLAFLCTNKVRAALTIEGATKPTVEPPSPEVADRPAAASPPPPAEQAAAGSPTPAPPTHIRRTTDEKARGLTPAQAAAERAARSALPLETPMAELSPASTEPSPPATPEPSEPSPITDAGAEWDAPAPVVISDAELNAACAAAAQKCGDPTKVRALKEPYNPNPGQPFTFTQIPQQHRAEVLEKLAAL